MRSDIHVMGDLHEALETLLPMLGKTNRAEWLDEVNVYKGEEKVKKDTNFLAYKIISTASELAPGDIPVVTDVGQHQMWTAQYFRVNRPRLFCSSGGLGTMGYGMGAAIGACFGSGQTRSAYNGRRLLQHEHERAFDRGHAGHAHSHTADGQRRSGHGAASGRRYSTAGAFRRPRCTRRPTTLNLPRASAPKGCG